MTKTRNISDLLDANGDVKSTALDNVPASNDASALTTGTLPSARLGTVTNFTSTGIDDNATSTAVTIDGAQRVRIGNTNDVVSPSYTEFMVIGDYTASQDNGITFLADATNSTTIGFTDDTHSTVRGAITYHHSGDSMRFTTFTGERMRIDSSGRVLIAHTGAVINHFEKFAIDCSQSSNYGIFISGRAANDGTQTAIRFYDSGTSAGVVGSITFSTNSTSYNTSSDYRLKENVSYDFDATTRLKQLKPARFNFIKNADTTVDGFLAHEVQDIVPEAITGEKDATETKEKVVVNANGNVIAENIEQADWETGKIADEDGNTKYPTDSTWEATKVVPIYQGIDQSKLVPLLVKTIQELEARITALETNNP